jgi:hypothetical protein
MFGRLPRLDLLCRIGTARYNALLRKHQRSSVVTVVIGYPIRTVVSQHFGTVFTVDGLDAGAPTLDGARALATAAPPRTTEGGD